MKLVALVASLGSLLSGAELPTPATPEVNAPVTLSLAAADKDRRHQRVYLATAAEVKSLGLNSKDIFVVSTAGAPPKEVHPVQWDERTKEPYFVLPFQAAGAALTLQLRSVESRQAEQSVEHAYMNDQLWMTTLADGVNVGFSLFSMMNYCLPGSNLSTAGQASFTPY